MTFSLIYTNFLNFEAVIPVVKNGHKIFPTLRSTRSPRLPIVDCQATADSTVEEIRGVESQLSTGTVDADNNVHFSRSTPPWTDI